jgi:hypothetical protein
LADKGGEVTHDALAKRVVKKKHARSIRDAVVTGVDIFDPDSAGTLMERSVTLDIVTSGKVQVAGQLNAIDFAESALGRHQ